MYFQKNVNMLTKKKIKTDENLMYGVIETSFDDSDKDDSNEEDSNKNN